MKKIKKLELTLTLLIVSIVPFLIPAKVIQASGDTFNSFQFGFPFNYLTVYQPHVDSSNLFVNLFSGNSGLHLNPLQLLIDCVIIYFILVLIFNYSKKFAK
ncbi:MAG: hypothetical protein ACRCVJ_13385 [Clostridium sp.]|uniref:hypothetical protein n=1 Tax=Clostridium sp. TaxID=1506 RepID=UPI003F3E717C